MVSVKLQPNLVISKRFLNRLILSTLAILLFLFAGYFFIDWRFLWPTPSLNLIKNQEDFYEVSFPSHIALGPYMRDYLYDYFLTNQATKLNFDAPPQASFYDRLTLETRKKFNSNFQIPSENEKQVLNRYLASYTNIFVQINQDKITINTAMGDSLADRLIPPARGRLVTLMLFDKKQGLFLKAPFLSYSTYLVRINRKNLRAFSVNPQGQLEDKIYPQICRSLAKIQSKDFYLRLFRLLIEGYRPELFSRLSEEEQGLLIDISGIYLAEVWRMKSMNLKENILQILPEASLLSLYFNSGGRFYPSEKIEPKLRTYQSCRHFALPHRTFVKYAEPHDIAITLHLKKKHPLLYYQLRWILPDKPDRLLEGLSRYVDNPTYYSFYVNYLFNHLIKILQKEAKEV